MRGEGWRAPPAGMGSTGGSSPKPGAVPARSGPVAARARSSCCPRPPSLLQVYMLVYTSINVSVHILAFSSL